jgi:hypothetical protein
VIDKRSGAGDTSKDGYGSHSNHHGYGHSKGGNTKLKSVDGSQFDRLDSDVELASARSSMKSEDRIIKEGGGNQGPMGGMGQVKVKTDIVVTVADEAERDKERPGQGQGGWSQAHVTGGGRHQF